MKLFGWRLLIFIVAAFLFYCFMVFLWGTFAPYYLKKNLEYRIPGFMNTRIKDISKNKNVDILFIGSSHAYRGFDPRIFERAGYHSFNLGSSSQTPIQSVCLLKKHLKELNPGLVILEVHPELFGLDGLESGLDVIANDVVDLPIAEMTIWINHVRSYNAFIYFGMTQWLEKEELYEEGRIVDPDTYIENTGFVERKISFAPNINYGRNSWTFRKEQLNALDEIIDFLNKQNCKLIMVWAPISNKFYQSFSNNDEAIEIFKRRGVFINFNSPYIMNDSLDFYNADHLNQSGVNKFNYELIRVLRERKYLKD